MRVATRAVAAVKEYLIEKDEEDAEAHRIAEEVADQCEITQMHEHELERQAARDEIASDARREYWSAEQWLSAMRGTYLFSDEELMPEYEERRRDDDWNWYWDPGDYLDE